MIDDVVAVLIIIFITLSILYSLNQMINENYKLLSYYKSINLNKENDYESLRKEVNGRSIAVLLYIKNANLSNEYDNLSVNLTYPYYIRAGSKVVITE